MKAPTFNELMDLKQHETAGWDTLSGFVTVLRVPHGFIYTTMDKGCGVMSSVFVPILNIKGED